MNRYETAFGRIKANRRIAFIPFAVAGDPDAALSEAIFKTYIDSGADILEIGYPFSDPIADGPVNQRSAMRAISSGLTHARFFNLMKCLRRYSEIPFGILLYANTIYHLGFDAFCRRAADAGIDSLLVADMPPEESGALASAMRRNGLVTVHIVSELTGEGRIARICRNLDGFVYIVSRLGPTGANARLSDSVAGTISAVRPHTDRPLCVGFGLSTPGHIREIHEAGADGAIVGSALVSIIEAHHQNPRTMMSLLARSVRAFRGAADDHGNT